MKLFIQNYAMDNIELEMSKSYTQEVIYSPSGIFLFKQKKWRKQNTIQEKYYELNYKNRVILVEDNVYHYDEIYTHIPYEHTSLKETFETHIVDYNLSLIKHSYMNQESIYFETKQTKVDEALLESLFSFLSKK
ncbi:hypothetical protein 162313513 [Organic Lake phycodnavirus 1]|nr:hypothetical protein 162313513 [Organic Lake phycodnavirus 1]